MRIKDDCKLTDARMDAYLDGTLDGASRAAFLGHVTGCDRCGRTLAFEEGLRQSCLALGAEGQEPPEGLHEGIMDAVRAGRSGRSRLLGALGSFSKAAAIVVISFSVGLGASVMIQRWRDAGDSAAGNIADSAGVTAASTAGRQTVPSAAFVAAGEPVTAVREPDAEVEAEEADGDMGGAAGSSAARAESEPTLARATEAARDMGADVSRDGAPEAAAMAGGSNMDAGGYAAQDSDSARETAAIAAPDNAAPDTAISAAAAASDTAMAAAAAPDTAADMAADIALSADGALFATAATPAAAAMQENAEDDMATGAGGAASAAAEPVFTFTDAEANAPENAKLVRELADTYGARFSEQAADGRRSVWQVELAADSLAPFVEALSAALAPRTAKINAPPAESAVVLVIIQDYK